MLTFLDLAVMALTASTRPPAAQRARRPPEPTASSDGQFFARNGSNEGGICQSDGRLRSGRSRPDPVAQIGCVERRIQPEAVDS